MTTINRANNAPVPIDPTPQPQPTGRSVAGTVLQVDGTPIAGLAVQPFHRRPGGEIALANPATTDTRGGYVAAYELPAGSSKVDLFVRAYDADKTVIAVSPIIIAAAERETLDLTVSDARFRGMSDFAVTTAALQPLLGDAALDTLNADDVALLVRNTGLSRESVTAWIAARRLSTRTHSDDPESLYGLIRVENTASLSQLVRRPAARLQRSLAAAAQSNLISLDALKRAQSTVTHLRRYAVDSSASTSTPGSLGRLLATSPIATPTQRAGFIRRYAANSGGVQPLWTALRKDAAFGDAVVDDLQLSLQLGTLTANHVALVKALRDHGVQRAVETAGLSTDDWQQLVHAVGAPSTIKGDTDAEREANYLTLLQNRVARAFPTATVNRVLKNLPDWQSSTAVAFLSQYADFDVLSSNITTALDSPSVVLLPDWNRAALESQLRTVQRVGRIAPEGKADVVVDGLLRSGYTSALQVARQSRESFRRKTAGVFADNTLADSIHRNAQFQLARVGSAYSALHPQLGDGVVDAIGHVSKKVTDDPTWASLFGNVDYCTCGECRSLYGPAAYLVDLLAWLDSREAGGQTAFDRLNARRPDIQRIELTCDNTETVLPYVDLVNEILEVRVLSADSSSTASVPQASTATSPELLANPEYLNPEVYNQYVSRAVFPFALPFDLWSNLGRVYFEHLGVRRSDLMEALQRPGNPSDEEIDAERLELSSAEWLILAGPSREEWPHWGYASATPNGTDYKADLSVVSNFLERAGLGYDQLLDLLHTRYVNRDGGLSIVGSPSNTDLMTIKGLTDATLNRVHRFLRLWRNRGWTMLELDKALAALRVDSIDGAALHRLANLDRVIASTGAALVEVLAWWGTIDSFDDRPEKDDPTPSLYAQVYLNRAVNADAADADFPLALNANGTALRNATPWDDLRPILQGALAVSADDLSLLLETVADGSAASLQGLSALYRHVSVARTLNLTVSDLLSLLRLVSSDPFDITHTQATIDLIRTLDHIRDSAFSLIDLRYLLEHDVEAEASVGVTDEAIGQTLVEIRDGLTRVTADAADSVVIEKTATFIGRGLDSAQDLLERASALDALRTAQYTTTTGDTLVASDDPDAFATLRRLYKAAIALNSLAFDIETQVWLFEVGVANGLFNPLSLPVTPSTVSSSDWTAWVRLVDLAALNTDLPGGEPTLVQLLNSLESSMTTQDTFLAQLAQRTEWSLTDLQTLASAFALPFPSGWRDGQTLRRVVDAFALIDRLAVSAATADAWATQAIGAAQSDELRLAAKSRHDEAQWPSIARDLRDPVRDKQRAALVGYLVARGPKYASDADLFDDLLIDVDMTPCMLTSRIKQAISSVQLFVQRAMLNLEDGVEMTRSDRDEWTWRKSYRVWEAARKIFLYPENWIEPELRSDKSPLFEDLENALLNGTLDDNAAESAFNGYLEGLLKIGRVEVMGVYHEPAADDETPDVLHLVARTRTYPHEYYYRQWIDAREWTAWEKLDVDIEGDHVILAVHDRRLLLFWPVVVQKSEASDSSDPDERPTQSDYSEMQLAWIERLNDQWSARNVSIDALRIDGAVWDDPDGRTQRYTYFRLVDTDEPDLGIECRYGVKEGAAYLLGRFTLDGGSGQVFVSEQVDITQSALIAPEATTVDHMRFSLESMSAHQQNTSRQGTPFVLCTADADSKGRLIGDAEEVDVLDRVSGKAFGTYAYPHQYDEFAAQDGIFLDDDQRTFHVLPQKPIDWRLQFTPDNVEPGYVAALDADVDLFQAPRPKPVFQSELPWDVQPSRMALPAPGARERATLNTPVLVEAGSLSSTSLQLSQVQLSQVGQLSDAYVSSAPTAFSFSLFYHPYVSDFMRELRRLGVDGLLDPDPDGPAADLVRQARTLDFFAATYRPTDTVRNTPVQDIDFDFGGAYAKYNWELFFHVPLLIACRLSQNQQFEDAQRWFHYIFDPTNRTDDTDPLRFWKIKPFYREADAPIEEFLRLAAATNGSAAAEEARDAYDDQIEAWLADPFDPHAIAQIRTTAYQKTVVMKYLDNLLAWGDQLFRQDTIESINEATQLYVLALELLGERPDALPPREEPISRTFEQVRADLATSVQNDPLVQLENVALPMRPRLPGRKLSPSAAAASAWAPTLYFCIPPNDKLLAYWDTVADRLFKIRNCMNIDGVVRQLPLFEPPIDPGMLVRARAAGVDLSSALSDTTAPLPHFRFTVMLQKAQTVNQTVRELGNALLSALEKADAEALANLRANQEEAVLAAIRQTKTLAIDEAQHTLTATERGKDAVTQRRDYYQALKDASELQDEVEQIKSLRRARDLQSVASGLAGLGAALTPIPAITTGVSGTMGTPVLTTKVTDGQKLAKAAELLGEVASLTAANASGNAGVLGVTAAFKRRAQEWEQQITAAEREISQIEKQIEAAQARVSMAQRDLDAHDGQIDNARTVRELMERKFSNSDLYQWMVGQLSSLYFQSYQLAYDLAKRAERAFQHELAAPQSSFVQFGYWDSLKKGLLSGERLQYDLDRMDKAYLDTNAREYEITSHISLALLDPVALLQLQTSGMCQFTVPEAIFDLDYAGQYLRRIKSVSLTVPCVTGPYVGVPMRLSLISSRTRMDPSASGEYPMDASAEDPRFDVQVGAVESIVISGGREDSGLFVADQRDERYLPFEGRGAISNWSLELTSAVETFDWTTIADVVLHVRYTSREAGEALRSAALASLSSELSQLPPRRAFSASDEFPTQWNAFLRPADGSQSAVLDVPLDASVFPRVAQNADLRITTIELVALVKDVSVWPGLQVTLTTGGRSQTVQLAPTADRYGGQPSCTVAYSGGMAPGAWQVSVPIDSMGPPSGWLDDLVLVVTYTQDLGIKLAL